MKALKMVVLQDQEDTDAAEFVEDYAALLDGARATVDDVYRELYSTPAEQKCPLEGRRVEVVTNRRS